MLEMVNKILGVTASLEEKYNEKAGKDQIIDLTGKLETLMEQKLAEVSDQVGAIVLHLKANYSVDNPKHDNKNRQVMVTQKTVEDKMDKLAETVEKQKTLESYCVLDRVDDVVRTKFKEDKKEDEELNKRKHVSFCT